MTIYHLIIYSLIPFIICIVLLSCSYSDEQSELIDAGDDESMDKLISTHTRYQKVIYIIGVISFLFTVCHVTIAAAMLVKELM